MKVQLSRFFGAESRIANTPSRSSMEWRRDLRIVLAEVHRYLTANIDTDPIHLRMLESGFAAAYVALDTEDFWPGYVEGITRITLCLMGNYPDHRKRKLGSKRTEHYKLDQDRTPVFGRNADQRLHTLFWTAPGIVELKMPPFEALHNFRRQAGSKIPLAEFLSWYKRNYPDDYAKVF